RSALIGLWTCRFLTSWAPNETSVRRDKTSALFRRPVSRMRLSSEGKSGAKEARCRVIEREVALAGGRVSCCNNSFDVVMLCLVNPGWTDVSLGKGTTYSLA